MDLEILNIPCNYPEAERRSQRFVFGAPNFAFNPLHFQRLWYLTHHQATIPDEVMEIMRRMQEIAKGSQITLGRLLQYAMDEPDADTEEAEEPRFSEENIIDIARLVAQKHAEEDEPDYPEEDTFEQSPLRKAFLKDKEKAVAFVAAQVGLTGKPALILDFLLSLESKDAVNVLREIDHEDVAGLTYKLCLYADCYGEEVDEATLRHLDAWLHLPYDEQVRGLLALFAALEAWVLREAPPPRIPFDLSEFHAELANFLLPLQKDGEKKSQFKALRQLLQKAEAGDAEAQAKWRAALALGKSAD